MVSLDRDERDDRVEREDERHAHAGIARVAELVGKISRRPEEEEPPHSISEETAENERPGLAERKRLGVGDLLLFLRRLGGSRLRAFVLVDVLELLGRDARVFGGLPVEPDPEAHPDEAERADDDERHLPAPELRNDRDRERRCERADGRAGVEDRGSERAVFLREVLGRHLDRRGEVARLAERQHRAAREEEPHGRGDAHHAEEACRLEPFGAHAARRVEARAQGPDEDRPQIPLLRPEPVDELAGEKVAQRVDDRERRRDRAVVVVGPVELGRDEVLPGEGEDLAVEVVDGRCEEEQRADDPAEVRFCFHGLSIIPKNEGARRRGEPPPQGRELSATIPRAIS